MFFWKYPNYFQNTFSTNHPWQTARLQLILCKGDLEEANESFSLKKKKTFLKAKQNPRKTLAAKYIFSTFVG